MLLNCAEDFACYSFSFKGMALSSGRCVLDYCLNFLSTLFFFIKRSARLDWYTL